MILYGQKSYFCSPDQLAYDENLHKPASYFYGYCGR